MSSNVTPSLEKSPPWTTKNRFRPAGERIGAGLVLVLGGGRVGEMSVARGTVKAKPIKRQGRRCKMVNKGLTRSKDLGKELKSGDRIDRSFTITHTRTMSA